MSMSSFRAAAVAATLAAGLFCQPAMAQCGGACQHAKHCRKHQITADGGPHGSLMIGVDSRWVQVVIDMKADKAHPKGTRVMGVLPINDCCPVVGPLAGSCMEVVAHYVKEMEQVASGLDSYASEPTCPYLKQQAAEKQTAGAHESVPEGGVLENLEHLEKARRLYHWAEYYRRTGHPATATGLYGRVQRLCPGSRYDHLAADALRQMALEQEIGDDPVPDEPAEGIPPLSRAAVVYLLALIQEPAGKGLPPETPADVPVTEDAPQIIPAPETAMDPEEEEADADDEEGQAVPEWNENFLRLLEDLPGGISLEFDNSREDGLRAECEIDVAGVDFRLTWSEPGQPAPAVQVLPHPRQKTSGTPRAEPEWLGEWLRSLEDSPFTEPPAPAGERDQ
jgi:hypothetical protein